MFNFGIMNAIYFHEDMINGLKAYTRFNSTNEVVPRYNLQWNGKHVKIKILERLRHIN